MSLPIDSLEKIIAENSDDFIFDSNIIADSIFSRYIYDCPEISDMDMGIVKEERRYIQKIDEIFLNFSNVYTIKEVSEEKNRFLQLCNEKYEWFKKKSKTDDAENLECFKQFNSDVFEMIKTVKKKLLKPNDKIYNKILQCTNLLSKEYELYTDYSKSTNSYGKRGEKRTDFQYLGTDEKLIAATFHRALIEKKDVSLVTKDQRMWSKFSLVYSVTTNDEIINKIDDLKKYNLKIIGLVEGDTEFNIKRQTKKLNEKYPHANGAENIDYLKKFKNEIEGILKA